LFTRGGGNHPEDETIRRGFPKKSPSQVIGNKETKLLGKKFSFKRGLKEGVSSSAMYAYEKRMGLKRIVVLKKRSLSPSTSSVECCDGRDGALNI